MYETFQNDKELIYITGKPVYLDGVPIHPITINDITDVGYSHYLTLLHFICADINDFIDNSEGKYTNEDLFVFMLHSYLNNEKAKHVLLDALSMICKTDNIAYDDKHECFLIDGGTLNYNNFLMFQSIVKERNGISKLNEDIDNPANAKAAALLARKKALKKKIDKAKDQDTSGITLADLISILASGMKLPISVICEYDMYQFNDQFNRLRIFKDYDVNVQALLAGADSNSIHLQHWISKGNSDESDE